MKILVIQLARLGDIYMSWPALRALRRQNPQAEIHVLTRPRFAPALEGLLGIDRVHLLSSKELLGPMVHTSPDIGEAFKRTSQFVDQLKDEKFDWILNFSFSPSSSYLTHAISSAATKVSGYTRYDDGFLRIPDDISAYFYAQVGVGRSNRFHLAEIFGTMVEADLVDSDWGPPENIALDASFVPSDAIVIHVGASEQVKSLSSSKWSTIINHLRKQVSNPIFLIGAANEKDIAESIMSAVPGETVQNWVGQTTLADTFCILRQCALLIGCDSAPMHMASLTGTTVLNLSLNSVNFWETGPRSPHSFILKTVTEDDLQSDKVASLARKILHGEKVDLGVVTMQRGQPCYRAFTSKEQEAQWQMVQAIYQGTQFPGIPDPLFLEGVEKLRDINQLMLEQMVFVQNGGDLSKVASIIDRGEEIIEAILNLVPPLAVLIRWYQTEKIRIAPAETAEVLAKTIHIHRLLEQVLEIYQRPEMSVAKETL